MTDDDAWDEDDWPAGWDDRAPEDDDELDRALEECGRLPEDLGGGCQLAATEHCDFDCPFRDGFPDPD